MTSKLSEIDSRIAAAHQLDAVIGAMRGMAAAREREAQERLAGIRSVAVTVGEAIAMVLAAAPAQSAREPGPRPERAQILIVLCTEQGFVGGFNERLWERVEDFLSHTQAELFIVGTRGMLLADERGMSCVWSAPMASHANDVARTAGAISDAVFARFGDHAVSAVWLMHAVPVSAAHDNIVTRRLVPFDFERFKLASTRPPPVLTLPFDRLLTGLAERYVYVQLCESLMLSFAAENLARMNAMLAASDHVAAKLETLVRESRIVRQDEITSEIVELATTAARTPMQSGAQGASWHG
ncbi:MULTISPECIES: F0F1 ATP synthase subunit gamma [Paraburkholderia]|uniref:F0F1 ATP synthase subunit gamma n=1 Tax=Paraburkholderia TaxID=1822464 RepID=UPI001CD4C2C9|nr:F0F1 ATP synthase subunit gamma [Paraburkholderia sp. XV]